MVRLRPLARQPARPPIRGSPDVTRRTGMLRPASWILPLALVTLLHGSPGTSGAAQSRPKEVRTSIGMRLVEILGG